MAALGRSLPGNLGLARGRQEHLAVIIRQYTRRKLPGGGMTRMAMLALAGAALAGADRHGPITIEHTTPARGSRGVVVSK